MPITSVNLQTGITSSLIKLRAEHADLQRQLATGRKAHTYGGLGNIRLQSLTLRHELGAIDAYRQTIKIVNTRVDVMHQALDRMRELVAQTASDGLSSGYDPDSKGQTLFQRESYARFTEMVALLNSNVGGRYLFGGRETGQAPLAKSAHILEGHDLQAGFKQVAAERELADLGADGRGRLEIGVAADEVTLAEDFDGSPFGFKLDAVTSTLSGTTVTAPAGTPPEITVTFTGTLPEDGETIRFDLDLPDGTKTSVTLTARANGPAGAGEFLIGADEDETAANFAAALGDSLQAVAQTELKAASVNAAANDFFDSHPPQRVDGPPFDSATALRAGTEADTVFWYRGEVANDPARQSVVAKIDDHVVVAYGARATEASFREPLKQLAILSTQTFPASDPDAAAHYAAVKERATDTLNLGQGTQRIEDVLTEIATAYTTLGKSDERLIARADMLAGILDSNEEADIYEVSASIIAIQTRIEASLAVTSMLSRLSLVNYM